MKGNGFRPVGLAPDRVELILFWDHLKRPRRAGIKDRGLISGDLHVSLGGSWKIRSVLTACLYVMCVTDRRVFLE